MASVGPAIGGHALLVGTFDGIPGQYQTIQEAVNAAQPGDWILIAPGDYHEQADHLNPPSANDVSLGWYGGVEIHTSDIHLRGMNRNSVVVDGTKPGAPQCSSNAADQDLGALNSASAPLGRNGIDIWANGDSVDNLTVCNFQLVEDSGGNQAGDGGNEIWWDGGDGSGKIGLQGYEGSYLTTTDTFNGAVSGGSAFGNYGIFSSNSQGPGVWNQTYANNFADSGMYIGACQQLCDAWVNNAWMENNALGYSGTNSGGTLVIEHSQFDNNTDGLDTNTQSAGDPPPPQNGACPYGGVSGFTEHPLVLGVHGQLLPRQQQPAGSWRRVVRRAARDGNDRVGCHQRHGHGQHLCQQRRLGHLVRALSRQRSRARPGCVPARVDSWRLGSASTTPRATRC